jgi:hypothetical protein
MLNGLFAIYAQNPVMLYNGDTHDARWRIGCVSSGSDFSCVTGRCREPSLLPAPPADRASTDIAFAASTVVEDELIALCYSLKNGFLDL